MAVPTHCCEVIVMRPLVQGLLGARQCAQVPGTTAGKALVTLLHRRMASEGQGQI